eukprot:scaffold118165_cov43-Cyclotella_meneghiniana.AAC.3
MDGVDVCLASSMGLLGVPYNRTVCVVCSKESFSGGLSFPHSGKSTTGIEHYRRYYSRASFPGRCNLESRHLQGHAIFMITV